MIRRTVIMYTEIGCFVLCISGWILVSSTMPIEFWNYSTANGIVLTTANFYSNLWKDCISDTTGVSDCKDFPSMMALDMYIHGCRGLVISSIALSFFASVLALVGMKCTKIGGSESTNAKVTFAAGITYLISGLSGMAGFSWYGSRIVEEFVDPDFKAQKYELGAALFIGWGGSTLLIVGGFIFTVLTGKEGCTCSSKGNDQPAPMDAPSAKQLLSAPEGTEQEHKSKTSKYFKKDAYV